MKNGFKGLGLMLLGTLLAAGCGGPASEPTQDMPAPAEGDNASAGPQESATDDSQLPGFEKTLPGTVSAQTACCYAKCSDRTTWHGPLKHVTPGNCITYSKYYCANHNWKYVGAKWDDC